MYNVHLITKNDSTKRVIISSSAYDPIYHYKGKAIEISLRMHTNDITIARDFGTALSERINAKLHDLVLD